MNHKKHLLILIALLFVLQSVDAADATHQPQTPLFFLLNDSPVTKSNFIVNMGTGYQFVMIVDGERKYEAEIEKQVEKVLTKKSKKVSSTCQRDPLFIQIERSLTILERYFESKNPTKITAEEISIAKWLGDDDEFINIRLRNNSEMPAENLRITVYAPSEPGSKASKILFTNKSKAWENLGDAFQNGLLLTGGQEMVFPLGSLREILASVLGRYPKETKFLGGGLTVEVPQAFKDEFSRNAIHRSSEASTWSRVEFMSVPVGLILIEYKTIFGRSITEGYPLTLYFGRDLN